MMDKVRCMVCNKVRPSKDMKVFGLTKNLSVVVCKKHSKSEIIKASKSWDVY
jgi:hypothetical protein